MTKTWHDTAKVHAYVERVGQLAPRQAGETELLEALPGRVERLLDLGCGDGRLATLVQDAHPELREIVAVDNSPAMLELATANLSDGASVIDHDLNLPLPATGDFDAIVSGFAIHHVSHPRKRSLFAELVEMLRPGGIFVNLEVVRCATPELHAEFHRRIGRDRGDPEDVLAEVEPQLTWMRQAGLSQVDCQWRWRGFALLVGARS